RVTARTFFGCDMRVHLPDLNSTRLYRYGFVEEGLTRGVIEHLQPGDVFIDVGAHVGYYTMPASLLVSSVSHPHPWHTVLEARLSARSRSSYATLPSGASRLTCSAWTSCSKDDADEDPKAKHFRTVEARKNMRQSLLDYPRTVHPMNEDRLFFECVNHWPNCWAMGNLWRSRGGGGKSTGG